MAEQLRKFTRKEIEETSDPNGTVQFVIHNYVYDVSKFIDDHPGGEEVYKKASGGDATECFEDVHHSNEAQELMKQFCVGELVSEDRREYPRSRWREPPKLTQQQLQPSTATFFDSWLSLVLFAGGALLLNSFLFE